MHLTRVPLLLAAALLAGCALQNTALVGADGTPCEGTLPRVVGLREHTDAALLASAKGRPGKGSLCDGRTYVVESPVTVYRVWNGVSPRGPHGDWWALDRPAAPVEAYRRAYAICARWGPRDRLVACTAKPGTVLVVGTGESMDCEDAEGILPRTPAVQVFLPHELAGIEGCTDAIWP